MSKEPFRFSENIRVKQGRMVKGGFTGNEYLAVSFRGETGDDREVTLFRYCVPGRCDTYSFTTLLPVCGPRHLAFFADGHGDLASAMSLVQKDLDKLQVIDLLVTAVSKREHRYYSRILINQILASIAPKSKAYRACVKELAKVDEQLKKDYEAIKVKKLAEARELVAANPIIP